MTKQITTIKIKLGDYSKELDTTMLLYNSVCQDIIDFGFEKNIKNKLELQKIMYYDLRKKYPKLQSSLIQCCIRDSSAILTRTLNENNKRIKYNKKISKSKKSHKPKKILLKPIKKELSGVSHIKTTLTLSFNKEILSISTINGRIKIPFSIASYYNKYKDWDITNAQLIKIKNIHYLNVQLQKDIKQSLNLNQILGIDLGINKQAVCSDNTFYSQPHLRNVKGKYKKLRRDLQSKGTKSSKRLLKKLSGKENRFVRDVNHCLSKQIINKNFSVFVLEDLSNIRVKIRTYNKNLNYKLGNWSFAQLQQFIKYKAERIGKNYIEINPKYTSQECSDCGEIHKESRNKQWFNCISCGYQLDADLNASRNIANRGRITLMKQGLVNNPNVGINENKAVEMLN